MLVIYMENDKGNLNGLNIHILESVRNERTLKIYFPVTTGKTIALLSQPCIESIQSKF